MADVFISYARQDRDWVETLAGEIERAGLTVWWDRQLSYGRSFETIIAAELEAARAIVVVWSKTAIQSDWVKDEAQAGRARGVLLPVLMEAVTPPLGFRQSHAANLARWPDDDQREFVKLLAEIGTLTGVDLTPPSPLREKREPKAVKPAAPRRSLRNLTLLSFAVVAIALAAVLFAIDWAGKPEPETASPAPAAPQAIPTGPSAQVPPQPQQPALPRAAARSVTVTLQTAGGAIKSVDISPDGSRVLAVSDGSDGAYLWDAQSGEEIGRLGSILESFVAFSQDGRRVATARVDRAQVWDPVHGTALGSAGIASGVLTGAVLSTDGKRIVTLSSGAAQLWDVDRSAMIAALGEPALMVRDAAYSPDGTLIATADGPGDTARIWKAADGATLATLSGHDNDVGAVTWSADGTRIVTSSDDGTAIVWNAATQERVATLGFHGDGVRRTVLSPDGMHALTFTEDGAVTLWTIEGERIAKLTAPLSDAVFTQDGAHLIGIEASGAVTIWNGITGAAEAALPEPSAKAPTALRLSRDGTRLAAARGGVVQVEAITLPGAP